jgi:hypothetical protein
MNEFSKMQTHAWQLHIHTDGDPTANETGNYKLYAETPNRESALYRKHRYSRNTLCRSKMAGHDRTLAIIRREFELFIWSQMYVKLPIRDQYKRHKK